VALQQPQGLQTAITARTDHGNTRAGHGKPLQEQTTRAL
jgi:hypothetical protein